MCCRFLSFNADRIRCGIGGLKQIDSENENVKHFATQIRATLLSFFGTILITPIDDNRFEMSFFVFVYRSFSTYSSILTYDLYKLKIVYLYSISTAIYFHSFFLSRVCVLCQNKYFPFGSSMESAKWWRFNECLMQ